MGDDVKTRWLTLLFLVVCHFGSAKMVSEYFYMVPAHNHERSTGAPGLILKQRVETSLAQLSLALSLVCLYYTFTACSVMWVIMWILQLGIVTSILIGFLFGVLLLFLANMFFEPPPSQLQPLALYGTTSKRGSDEKDMTHQEAV
jgi:Kef-type K+ transport system membrane component KefB